MKRLSNIMESFWGDVHKRSRGDEIRQEDIAATCVIDGVEYKFTSTFMGMGDTYNEENSDEWYCFAFNKMPNGSTIIDGDTDSAGCFGIDMYDMQDWDEWDVFVLKDYLEKTKEELVDESINAGHINDIGIAKIESILVNYIEEIFEKHMSDFARYYIFELQPSDWNNSLFTVWTNIDDLPDNVKEEFDGYDIVEMHQISFPSLVEWDWDDRLVKDLTDAYEELGWKRSEEYSLSVKAPGKTRGECFVKLSEKGVKESFWGDVHKRSRGDEVRKEDAFNPEYVDFGPDTTVYWAVDNLEIDGEVKFYFDDVKDYNNNGWRLPTVDEVKQLKWIREMAYYRGCKHIKFDDGQELRLKTNGSGGFHMWTKEINPKFPTGAYAYGYDNSYDFDIDSFNKSINRLFVFLVKDKKVTESFWGDVHKRSRGDAVRREDDVDLMDMVEFYEYIQELYSDYTRLYIDIHHHEFISVDTILVRGISKQLLLVFDWTKENDKQITLPYSFRDKFENVFNKLTEKFSLEYPEAKDDDEYDDFLHNEFIYIHPKDGKKITNRFYIEVLDYIIKKANGNLTESFWGDVHKRSRGDEIRKEDEIGNLRSLKPVDMGGSVLWADQNLIYDGDEIFTFEDANNLISDSGWRLPTRKEVAELDGHNIYYDTQYIYLDDDKKLSFKKCGCGYTPKTGKPFTLDENKAFYGWTSEPYQYSSNDIHVFILDHFELAYSPEKETINNQVTQNADTKCCVRLVKDK